MVVSRMKPLVAAPAATEASGAALAEFEAVYRANVRVVTAFFARRSIDPQVVADLTADTFVEAIRSFGSFDPGKGAPRPWLIAIARRVHARYYQCEVNGRAALRRSPVQLLVDSDEIEELEGRIDAERSGRALIEQLADLSAVEREAVELVDVAGFSPKEAAGALGVSPGTLRVRLFRARAHLRKEHLHV